MQGGAGFFLQLAGGQEVIEVRMGVNDADHLQAQGIEPSEDQFVIATRVDHDGLFGDRVADDRAVALQRADREGFADQRRFGSVHGCSWKKWMAYSRTARRHRRCHPLPLPDCGSGLQQTRKRLIYV
ncbi:hypothetical protein D3C73_1244650 [compost metagenome]